MRKKLIAGMILIAAGVTLACIFAGCAVGPDYKRPTADTPPAWQEPAPWKEAVPQDTIAKGNWWRVFNDSRLDELELIAANNNQNVKAAYFRVEQARAVARITESDLFPSATLDPSARRYRESANRPLPASAPSGAFTSTDLRVPFDLSYEIDLWGRIRRNFESTRADAQASRAAYENVLLTLQADVARTYFEVRSLDSERVTLRKAIEDRRKALNLAEARFKGGVSSELDLTQAQTELANAESDFTATEQNRGTLTHALAILLGKAPAEFIMDESPLDILPPAIPVGLPSDILERRPDVSQAERNMASKNAQIGVAKASFFPVVKLTGYAGFESSDISNLFSWSGRQWSLGPSLYIPIFESGQLSANLKRSKAAYEEAVALYRQQVLVAFGEVEDSLVALRVLSNQAEIQNRAVAASRKAADISTARYKAGLVTFLEVADTDRTMLQSERLAAQIQGQRLVSSVLLIKALGGGWDSQPATAKK